MQSWSTRHRPPAFGYSGPNGVHVLPGNPGHARSCRTRYFASSRCSMRMDLLGTANSEETRIWLHFLPSPCWERISVDVGPVVFFFFLRGSFRETHPLDPLSRGCWWRTCWFICIGCCHSWPYLAYIEYSCSLRMVSNGILPSDSRSSRLRFGSESGSYRGVAVSPRNIFS